MEKSEDPEHREDHQVGNITDATNGGKIPVPTSPEDTNMDETVPIKPEGEVTRESEASKDHGDDGGEVVEGAEDTVIY